MLFVFGLLLGSFFFVLHPSGRILFFPPLTAQRTNRRLIPFLLGSLVTVLMGNLVVLLTISSQDVRHDADEIGFYLATTAFFLGVTLFAFEFLGVSFRDDVAARRNPAAAAVVCGLILGEGFCLAGSNSGSGPGPEAAFFCVLISTSALLFFWALFATLTEIVERITVERDRAAGIRAGAFLGGAGAVLGGSVAGNWISLSQTAMDFAHFGWPVVLLLVAAIGAEAIFRKRSAVFSASYSIITLTFCVAYAVRIWGVA